MFIETPEGKQYSYESHPKVSRHFGSQFGQPLCETIRTPIAKKVNNTPKKAKRKMPMTTPVPVKNLPGKKKTKPTSTRTTGRCKICKIIFESNEDKEFRKRNLRKTTWIGCDKTTCQFWAHALCAGLLLQPKKAVKDHQFFCKDHR